MSDILGIRKLYCNPAVLIVKSGAEGLISEEGKDGNRGRITRRHAH